MPLNRIPEAAQTDLLGSLANFKPYQVSLYRELLIAAKVAYGRGWSCWLQRELGVNRYYFCRIINEADFEPPDWVCRELGIVKSPPRADRFLIYPDPEHLNHTLEAIHKHMEPETFELLIARHYGKKEEKAQ